MATEQVAEQTTEKIQISAPEAETEVKTEEVQETAKPDPQTNVDPSGYTKPSKADANGIRAYTSFDDMNLKDQLLRGIYGYGFEKPSAIQQKAIVPMVSGRDIIGQAQSGSGKTAAFVVGALAQVEPKKRKCQALVLAPTRELAIQIHSVATQIGRYMDLQVISLIGGSSVRNDIGALQNGVHMCVGTPGRVGHMIGEGFLQCNNLKLFVLDEADELLSRGFMDSIYDIFQYMPNNIQACLFSATMPNEVLEVTTKFMREPISILVKAEELTLEGIEQFYIYVEQEQYKLETLCDLYEYLCISQSMIYVNTRNKCEGLARDMDQRDFSISMMHSQMDRDQRKDVMSKFRSGASRVLISTDLLARGIDVQGVSLVINYDLPLNRENYLHRIGRSGRFGRKGVAINFVKQDDTETLKELEQYYGTEIREMPDPTTLVEMFQ